jgi:hypothetical protein
MTASLVAYIVRYATDVKTGGSRTLDGFTDVAIGQTCSLNAVADASALPPILTVKADVRVREQRANSRRGLQRLLTGSAS